MRHSKLFPPTLREMRSDLIVSHRYLEQGGFIRQVGAAGVFALLPLGKLVHDLICGIVFDEMSKEGIQHLDLPILQSRSLWEQTGRWGKYQQTHTMFVAREYYTKEEFGLSPTAEEVVTLLAAMGIKSYRQLPVILHQIGPKFRDEMRPRYGMVRSREFSMSDAYSFDVDEAGMRESFELMRRIYTLIFERLGLKNCISVHADSGAIGGSGSAEFMAVCDVGEDTLLTCDVCGYGANIEKADSRHPERFDNQDARPIRYESTPGIKTVEELENFFPEVKAHQMIKTIIFTVNPDASDSYEVAVCIRGDLDINQVKLTNILKANSVVAAADSVVEEATGAAVGFAGPLGLKRVQQIIFDRSTKKMRNFLCGYNTTDHHALDVNFERDLPRPKVFHELHTAMKGHGCPECNSVLVECKGIEVGHVFMLQQEYARAMNATFLDEQGNGQVMWMGCYGIGTTRLMHAIVEQNNDEHGICWPLTVAPFLVHIVPVDYSNETQRSTAEALYHRLTAANVDVLIDDRMERAGVKFNDADLIGCPYRVTIGRDARQGIAEFRERTSGEIVKLSVDEIASRCVALQRARHGNSQTINP